MYKGIEKRCAKRPRRKKRIKKKKKKKKKRKKKFGKLDVTDVDTYNQLDFSYFGENVDQMFDEASEVVDFIYLFFNEGGGTLQQDWSKPSTYFSQRNLGIVEKRLLAHPQIVQPVMEEALIRMGLDAVKRLGVKNSCDFVPFSAFFDVALITGMSP